MHILSLRAENVKRLQAVYIEPNGSVIELIGRNRQGKTSILDAIWWALAGGDAVQDEPIRKGQEKALVQMQIGDYLVTRTFKAAEGKAKAYTQTLTIENKDGFKAGSPQKMLDDLVGKLTFDPLAFTRMDAEDQLETLKQFVPDFDFAANAKAAKDAYAERTDVNRDAKRLRAAAETVAVTEEETKEVDETALIAELEEAGQHNAMIERRTAARAEVARKVENLTLAAAARDREAVQKQAEINDLQRRIDTLKGDIVQIEKDAEAYRAEAAAEKKRLDEAPPLPEPKDTIGIRTRIEAARAANLWAREAAAAKERRKQLVDEAAAKEAESKALTDRLETLEKERQDAVKAAKMPVEGIGFGDDHVRLNGVPFDQASDAEQLETALAIAAAMNPKLKIIRIRDGSLLDDDAWKALVKFAEEKGFQCWVESVQSDHPGAIVIEDGMVAGVVGQKAAE